MIKFVGERDMFNQHKYRFIMAILVLVLAALACNMPRRDTTPSPSGADAIYTAAAETVEAQLTSVSQPPVTPPGTTAMAPTATSIAQFTPSATSQVPTSAPPATAGPTATPVPCNLVKFVQDVTYPDDTEVDPGEVFVKTWRLQNAGSCAWSTAYDLAFVGGDAMGAPASVPLGGSVAPGETIDLSLTLTAPDTGGTYRGDYKLRDASNVLFGLGDGTKPFWVQVKVPFETGIVYDFISKAENADWTTGVGNDPGDPIEFDGDDNDANGVAKVKDQIELETGSTSGKVLLSVPKHESNGFVQGVFPEYKVQSGDRFKGTLGFMIPEGTDSCGSGKVKFQLAYLDDDDLKLVAEWTKECNGLSISVSRALEARRSNLCSWSGRVVFSPTNGRFGTLFALSIKLYTDI
jgi:hypothetical protein